MEKQYFIRAEDKSGGVKLIGRAGGGAPWKSANGARRAGATFDRKHGAALRSVSIAIRVVDSAGRVIDTSQLWLD